MMHPLAVTQILADMQMDMVVPCRQACCMTRWKTPTSSSTKFGASSAKTWRDALMASQS